MAEIHVLHVEMKRRKRAGSARDKRPFNGRCELGGPVRTVWAAVNWVGRCALCGQLCAVWGAVYCVGSCALFGLCSLCEPLCTVWTVMHRAGR